MLLQIMYDFRSVTHVDTEVDKTPTVRTVEPPAEPSVPLERNELGRGKNMEPPSPPPSPHNRSSSPSMDSRLDSPRTPPRQPNIPIEYRTPSPPHGLPDLPGPPSSDEELTADLRSPWYTQNTTSLGKTPRPPGAWAPTPLPRSNPSLPVRASSNPPDDISNHSGLVTPAASLSRATSLPPQTPAFPGAWAATPFSRKSVHFGTFNPQDDSVTDEETDSGSTRALRDSGIQAEASIIAAETSASTARPTKRALSPSRPKSPGVRLVDAFGREQKEDERSNVSRTTNPEPDVSGRNRSTVRILDSMGREVENPQDSPEPVPLKQSDVASFVRKGLSELTRNMNDLDEYVHSLFPMQQLRGLSRQNDDRIHFETRVAELNEVSKVARATRIDIKNQLRSSYRKSKLFVCSSWSYLVSHSFCRVGNHSCRWRSACHRLDIAGIRCGHRGPAICYGDHVPVRKSDVIHQRLTP